MKIFRYLVALLLATGAAFSSEYNFEEALAGYSKIAKEISVRQITKEDEDRLFQLVIEILKNLAIQDFIFKYFNGSGFPNLAQHENDKKDNDIVANFTIAIYTLYRNLTDDLIREILKKSPLEMVSILREINALLQFVQADPRTYGHGQFKEKDGDITTVFATNEAIIRIMKPVILSCLLSNNAKIYKLSRVTSALYRAQQKVPPAETFKTALSSMKRSTADDSRIAVWICIEQF
ncbi:MAG: hypothetical protein LBT03_03250 [Holosporales bacterium]|jgi:hypothetical protein|nr:hypothetical protein [Holosporales bacterium]